MGFFRGLWGGLIHLFSDRRTEGTEAQCKTHMHYFFNCESCKTTLIDCKDKNMKQEQNYCKYL